MSNRSNSSTGKIFWNENLQVLFAVTLMAVLGVSSVTPAFPRVIAYFKISPQAVGLLITVFTLPGVLLTPVTGILADRMGRKKILIPSLFLFGSAGFLCAFTRTFSVLLILRFLQGIGAASLGSLNVTIIGDLFHGKDRATAMGYNASILSVGTASYPALGGLLALLGWNYPFLLPVLAIPVGSLVIIRLQNPEPQAKQHLRGYFTGVWRSMDRRVMGLFIVSTITFILLYGAFLTYYPILIGNNFGGSALIIGLIMSSMSVTTAIVSSQLGKLIKKFSVQTLIKISFVLYGTSLLLIPIVPNAAILLIPTVIFGLAHGVNIPGIQTLLAGLAPMEHRAAFMSANGMVLRLGQTLGPLIAGFFFVHWGISGVFLGMGFLGLATVFISGWMVT
jgi:ACDE family multidrug resistance protein